MHAKDLIPIPRLLSARNVLVIFPHPDDAELAAGGTIALLAKNGASVTYVCATDGSLGSLDPAIAPELIAQIRKKELEAAAEVLGVKEIIWLGYRDGYAPEPPEMRPKMVSIIRKVQPDFVITLDPWLAYEAHPDHRKVSMAAVEACMYASFNHAYPEDRERGLGPWSVTGVALGFTPAPNTFVDVGPTWDTKIQAILCHKSQFPEHIWSQVSPYMHLKAQEYGKEIGKEFAEPFKVLSLMHLHVNIDAWRS
ncbi:MAG: PIG-L family deacetylase [Firmicutes bacterium]|nr:PIG-L family deacetylase [Candidatus Fermentithermobacillaceae bacterium]